MRMNSVQLCGRLAQEPTLRKNEDQSKSSLRFIVAVSRTNKQDSAADFVPCIVWGKYAETCAEHLKKGKEVLVNGRIRTNSRQDPETQEWSNFWEVACDGVSFGADSKKQTSAPAETAEAPAEPMIDVEAIAQAVVKEMLADQARAAAKAQEEGLR